MHDVQAAAALFVGESATMASESVVLGTPSIYIDEVGRGYTDEEAREGLLWMFRPVPNSSHLTIAPPPADALLSPFHSPSATLACSPTQFNSTQNVPLGEQVNPSSDSLACSFSPNNATINSQKEQVTPLYSSIACSPTTNNSSANAPLREQVSAPDTPSQLVPQLTNSTSNNPLGEQVKSEPWWISGGVEECIACAEHLASPNFDIDAYAKRHASWMATKIDCTAFLTWFIEEYPQSVEATRKADAGFWERFK